MLVSLAQLLRANNALGLKILECIGWPLQLEDGLVQLELNHLLSAHEYLIGILVHVDCKVLSFISQCRLDHGLIP